MFKLKADMKARLCLANHRKARLCLAKHRTARLFLAKHRNARLCLASHRRLERTNCSRVLKRPASTNVTDAYKTKKRAKKVSDGPMDEDVSLASSASEEREKVDTTKNGQHDMKNVKSNMRTQKTRGIAQGRIVSCLLK